MIMHERVNANIWLIFIISIELKCTLHEQVFKYDCTCSNICLKQNHANEIDIAYKTSYQISMTILCENLQRGWFAHNRWNVFKRFIL